LTRTVLGTRRWSRLERGEEENDVSHRAIMLIVLGLVAPTVVLALVVAATMIASRFYRRKCPACMQRGLKRVSVVRTFTETRGVSTPEYWSYLRCEKCGERFKLHDGILSGVPEDERDEATRFG
jgi:hypothetical protein